MKSLKTLFIAFILTVALAAGLSAAGLAPVQATAMAAGIVLFSTLLPKQEGVLGAYVGTAGSAASMSSGETGIQVITTERERAVLEHNKNRPEFKGRKLTPSFLRLETDILNTSGKLSFKTFIGDGTTVYPTERRLDRNDDFIATEMGFFLIKQDTANSKTNALLLSYPNITVFGAAAAADLKALYTSGKLRINVGREDKFVALDIARFLHIPETQQTAGTNYDETSEKSGFINLTPQLILQGNGTNEVEIDFTTYAGFAGGTSADVGFKHRAVLYFRGLLATGSQTR